jgi:hypothetical protein
MAMRLCSILILFCCCCCCFIHPPGVRGKMISLVPKSIMLATAESAAVAAAASPTN